MMIVMNLLFYVLSSSLCVSICEGNAAVSVVGGLDFVEFLLCQAIFVDVVVWKSWAIIVMNFLFFYVHPRLM